MSSEAGSFRGQVKRSSSLLALRFASNAGLRLVSTVVLSRLLAPEVYGVFAIVLVYMYVLEMLSDFGLRPLILTREGEVSEEFLKTCWTFSILRGLLILVVSVLLGAAFAVAQSMNVFSIDSAYSAQELPYAIAALGVGMLIFGFGSPHRFMSERAMAFGRVTAVDVARNLITLVITIGLALYLRSVWALVLGQLVRSSVHVALSFLVFSGPRLGLCLHRQSAKIMIDRGKWVLGESALTVVSQSFDRIFLGFVMNSTTFGFYYIARQLAELVPQFLQALNGAMILQVFKKLHQSTPEQFRRNYYRYRLVLDTVAGLVVGGMVILAPLFVEIVFDDRYAGVAPIMQVLALGLLLFGALVLRSAFTAQQRFDVSTKLSVLSAISLIVGLSFATFAVSSVELVVCVVALHRLPEAILIVIAGRREGWVVLWRETLVFGVFGFGMLLSYGVLLLWRGFF